MELSALVKAVNVRRGSVADAVSTDDVIQAIKKLRSLGGGFDVVTIGSVKVSPSLLMWGCQGLEHIATPSFCSRCAFTLNTISTQPHYVSNRTQQHCVSSRCVHLNCCSLCSMFDPCLVS